jgi:hypothetical protein
MLDGPYMFGRDHGGIVVAQVGDELVGVRLTAEASRADDTSGSAPALLPAQVLGVALPRRACDPCPPPLLWLVEDLGTESDDRRRQLRLPLPPVTIFNSVRAAGPRALQR